MSFSVSVSVFMFLFVFAFVFVSLRSYPCSCPCLCGSFLFALFLAQSSVLRFCDCIKQDGSTMMHIAAQAGHPDTAMVFLKKGVPLHMPNKVISYVSCDSVVVTIR